MPRGHRSGVRGAVLDANQRIISFDHRNVNVWSMTGKLQLALSLDSLIMHCDGRTIVTARDGRLSCTI